MTDETGPDENSENGVLVPEVVEEEIESSLSLREKQLLKDAVRFINQTVKGMYLNAALRIGDYLLTVFFNNDLKRAVSNYAFKSASLSSLCRRTEISLDRRDLAYMVKIAAQERFIKQIDLDTSDLNYTHRKYLTRLPNDGTKMELIEECVKEEMPTRDLLIRIKEIESSEKTVKSITAERMIKSFITRMDRSMEKIAIPETLSEPELFSGLLPDTRMALESKTMQWLEHLEDLRSQYSDLLEMLKNDESSPP
ncbi:MAG: hypothetical protein GXP53_06450 [Deltaproteobacteria bacterium]|nr:hypothetical protein [Deltaproteobacteria bacterium]